MVNQWHFLYVQTDGTRPETESCFRHDDGTRRVNVTRNTSYSIPSCEAPSQSRAFGRHTCIYHMKSKYLHALSMTLYEAAKLANSGDDSQVLFWGWSLVPFSFGAELELLVTKLFALGLYVSEQLRSLPRHHHFSTLLVGGLGVCESPKPLVTAHSVNSPPDPKRHCIGGHQLLPWLGPVAHTHHARYQNGPGSGGLILNMSNDGRPSGIKRAPLLPLGSLPLPSNPQSSQPILTLPSP